MTDNIVDIYQCHSFYFTSYNAHTKWQKEKENKKIKKKPGNCRIWTQSWKIWK